MPGKKVQIIPMTPATLNRGKADLYERSYHKLFKAFWPEINADPLVSNWHIKVIADELQLIGQRVVDRLPKEYDLIINVPPGTSKSNLASQIFPLWLWIKDPSLNIISGSHTSTLSIKNSGKSRDLIRSSLFNRVFDKQWWIEKHNAEFYIRSDVDAKTRYKNSFGGERIATSSGSSIIGEHAHIQLIDDPIDPQGVKSEVIMEKVNKWIDQTLSTRKVSRELTPTVLIMQRLHEEDPTGNWLKEVDSSTGGRRIRHICFPATNEYDINPPEYERFYTDGLLDPVRLTKASLEEAKVQLGSMDFAGQYGQSPRQKEGNLVKKWMLPVIPWSKVPRDALKKVRDFTVDSADKENMVNDPSGFLCYTEFKGYLIIFNYMDLRARFSKRVQALRQFIKDNGSEQSRVFIEPKSSGVAIMQFLQDHTTINAMEWKMAEGDKMARLNAIIPFLEARKAILVEGPWNDDFIHRVTTFPNVKHKEPVDCLSMAGINTFLRKVSTGYRMTFPK